MTASLCLHRDYDKRVVSFYRGLIDKYRCHSTDGWCVHVSDYIKFKGAGLMCIGISIQVSPVLCLSMLVSGTHPFLNSLIQ
jgi:hypothetical protein